MAEPIVLYPVIFNEGFDKSAPLNYGDLYLVPFETTLTPDYTFNKSERKVTINSNGFVIGNGYKCLSLKIKSLTISIFFRPEDDSGLKNVESLLLEENGNFFSSSGNISFTFNSNGVFTFSYQTTDGITVNYFVDLLKYFMLLKEAFPTEDFSFVDIGNETPSESTSNQEQNESNQEQNEPSNNLPISDDDDFSGRFGNFSKNEIVYCSLYLGYVFKVKKVTILQNNLNSYTFTYVLKTCGKYNENKEIIYLPELETNVIFVPSSFVSNTIM
ncbi:hypothetical protein [Campylobacter hyointestinalis]|uniref:hypothetical protein n=1 Tax=Campylobacter hyointestinalis TaxID=198 RepID=UPI00072B6BAA|nr:hypothetical protein [Campylobacter hyointestinalis]CUU75185.1 Uncharacterised protein [Campylobacter hyointestinalis subsp. hyointestinalis]